ncbi:MAG: Ig-like domain-containing protein [Armatimonadota bacterium]
MLKSQNVLAVVVLALCMSVITLATPAFSQTNAPMVSIVAPMNGATISGTQVEITVGFSSDENHPVSKVRIFLNGQTVTERIFEAPSARGNTSFKWDTTRTPNGRHQVDAQVFSPNGDYLGMATCVVAVLNKPLDLAAPKVSITNPKEGDIVSGVKTISVSSVDDSGIDPLVSIYIDDAFRSVSNTKPYTYDWDTTKQENGPHIITVKATDDADNQGAAKPVKVIVRNSVNTATTSTGIAAVTTAEAPKNSNTQQNVASAATPVDNGVNANESARTTASQELEVNQTLAPKPVAASSAANVKTQAATPVTVQASPAKPTQVVKVTPAPKPVQTATVTSAPKPATVTVTAAAPKPAPVVKVTPAPVTVAKVTPSPAPVVKQTPAPVQVAKNVPAPVKSETVAQTATAPETKTPAAAASAPKVKVTVKEPVAPKPAAVAVSESPKPTVVVKEPAPKPVVIVKEPVAPKPTQMAKVIPAPAPVVAKPAPVVVRNATPAKTVKVAKAETNKVKVAAAPKSEATVETTSVKSCVIRDKEYIVQSGDSVSKIAYIFGVSSSSLVALNNIEDPKMLMIGDKLELPTNAKMVRIRSIVDGVGGTIEWNPKAKTVRAIYAQSEIKVKIGSRNATVNNQQVKMERPAKIHSGRTLVPTSFVSDTVEK